MFFWNMVTLKVKINGDKKELLVYTSEPTELLKVDGLAQQLP